MQPFPQGADRRSRWGIRRRSTLAVLRQGSTTAHDQKHGTCTMHAVTRICHASHSWIFRCLNELISSSTRYVSAYITTCESGDTPKSSRATQDISLILFATEVSG